MSQAGTVLYSTAHLGVASSQLFVIYAVGIMNLNTMIQRASLGLKSRLVCLGTQSAVGMLPATTRAACVYNRRNTVC